MKWELVVIYVYISGLKTGKEPALLERTASHWYTYLLLTIYGSNQVTFLIISEVKT
jgi:hypothetical protein